MVMSCTTGEGQSAGGAGHRGGRGTGGLHQFPNCLHCLHCLHCFHLLSPLPLPLLSLQVVLVAWNTVDFMVLVTG